MLIAVVTVLLAVVPGAGLGFVVPPGRERWAVWASAPVLTLGLISVGLAWLPGLGLPSGAGWILGLEVVLAAAAVATARWRDRRAPTGDPGHSNPTRDPGRSTPPRQSGRSRRRLPSLVDLIALAVPSAVCLVFAELMLGGLRYPPGWDGENHGFLTRTILATGSTEMTRICIDGTTAPAVTCHFYPLAMDVSWAQSAQLSGGPISTAMLTSAIVVAPLCLVVALYATVRAFGGSAIVAACAALAPALIGPLWAADLGGRVPEEAAPGLSVAVALLAALAVRGRYPMRMGLLAGLGMAGLLVAHTYDVVFAATLAAAYLTGSPGRLDWHRAGVAVLAAAGAAVLTVLPFGAALLGANGERASQAQVYAGRFWPAVRFWTVDLRRYTLFGFPAPGDQATQLNLPWVQVALWLIVPCLLASPLCLAFDRLRWARPWLLMWVVWTAVAVWTSYSTSSPAQFLNSLWYGTPERLHVMILPIYAVLAVAGAGAIGLTLSAVIGLALPAVPILRAARLPAWRRLPSSALAPALAVLLIVSLSAIGTFDTVRLPLRRAFADRTGVGPSYPRIFDWLAQHTSKDQVVAFDRNTQFLVWSYVDHGTGLLFGIPPLVAASRPNAAERDAVWNWLVNNPATANPGADNPAVPDPPAPKTGGADSAPGSAPAGCYVRKYGVAYVVVGGGHMPGFATKYEPSRLARSRALTLVHRDGALLVYQVTPAGAACPPAP